MRLIKIVTVLITYVRKTTNSWQTVQMHINWEQKRLYEVVAVFFFSLMRIKEKCHLQRCRCVRARVEETIAFFTHLVAELDPESVVLLNEYKKNKEENIIDVSRFSR